MTGNPTNVLVALAVAAVIAAAATWPPVQAAGLYAVETAAGAFRARFFDSQSFRCSCM